MPLDNNKNGMTRPVILASLTLQKETVEYFISKGADPKLTDEEGCGYIYKMAVAGKLELIQFFHSTFQVLLEPEKITAENFDLCPLIGAINSEQYETFKTLITLGASYQFTDKDNVTPFHIVIKKGNIDCINFLLEKGVDMRAQTKFGDTPLSLAIQNNRLDIVKLLIKKDSELLKEHNHPYAPLLFSANKKNWEILKFLIKYGAKHIENWNEVLKINKEKIDETITKHVFEAVSTIYRLMQKQKKLTNKHFLIEKQKKNMQNDIDNTLNFLQEGCELDQNTDNNLNKFIKKHKKLATNKIDLLLNTKLLKNKNEWSIESENLIDSIKYLEEQEKTEIDNALKFYHEKIFEIESGNELLNIENELTKKNKQHKTTTQKTIRNYHKQTTNIGKR